MKWISIKEELPKDNKPVLMWVGCFNCGLEYLGRTHQCGVQKLIYTGYSGPIIIGRYNKRNENYWWSPINPSFWMPLPNQPERLSEKTSKEDAIV